MSAQGIWLKRHEALAEFLLLAMFGGLGFASIVLGESMRGLYRKADRFLLGLFAARK